MLYVAIEYEVYWLGVLSQNAIRVGKSSHTEIFGKEVQISTLLLQIFEFLLLSQAEDEWSTALHRYVDGDEITFGKYQLHTIEAQ